MSKLLNRQNFAMSSTPSESAADGEHHQGGEIQPPSHHPYAPADNDELFDISTTVDPSYIISLIRKLLPPAVNVSVIKDEVDAHDSMSGGPKDVGENENSLFPSEYEVQKPSNNECEAMDTVDEFGYANGQSGSDDRSVHHEKQSIIEDSWEDYGCILWDLAASRTHAELMVENLILEVLSTTLKVSQSPRVTEISLGILGNLACYEVSREQIACTNGLIQIIVDQLFSDDTPCLSEACRLLASCLQGNEYSSWVEALQSEHVLSRILWIAENTLNQQLIEKSVGLLLAVLESRKEVTDALLPPLVMLGLPGILVNLLTFELSILMGERSQERYSILELILHALEALSVINSYSQEISSDRKLLQLLSDLIKLPDKVEVASSCVTAAVLVANILSDADDVALTIIEDVFFLQGLFDIFPCASDDIEARSALWDTIGRILSQVLESRLSPSILHHYVYVLVSRLDIIEDELLDNQLNVSNEERESLAVCSRTIALRRIYDILSQWKTSKDHFNKDTVMKGIHVDEGDVDRVKDCCGKYLM